MLEHIPVGEHSHKEAEKGDTFSNKVFVYWDGRRFIEVG